MHGIFVQLECHVTFDTVSQEEEEGAQIIPKGGPALPPRCRVSPCSYRELEKYELAFTDLIISLTAVPSRIRWTPGGVAGPQLSEKRQKGRIQPSRKLARIHSTFTVEGEKRRIWI